MTRRLPYGESARGARPDCRSAVVGLGENLFYGTGIPAAVVFINKDKPAERREKVLIVNGEKNFADGKNQNRLEDEHVSKLAEAVHRYEDQDLLARVVEVVENHHNFAWKEEHDGEELIVHRKGATPANEGELGIIPATMVDEAKIVSGKGEASSLRSAAHGAGRVMSRTEGRNTFSWNVNKQLDEKGVTLLSAGLDESPGVYKDIDEVMSHQEDLVETIGGFQPVIVKMADD